MRQVATIIATRATAPARDAVGVGPVGRHARPSTTTLIPISHLRAEARCEGSAVATVPAGTLLGGQYEVVEGAGPVYCSAR
jgi:hypothetical protein